MDSACRAPYPTPGTQEAHRELVTEGIDWLSQTLNCSDATRKSLIVQPHGQWPISTTTSLLIWANGSYLLFGKARVTTIIGFVYPTLGVWWDFSHLLIIRDIVD